MSDALADTDRERLIITEDFTTTTPRDSPSTMKGGSTGDKAHSWDRKGDGSRHIRDETGTTGFEHNSLGIQDDRQRDDSSRPESPFDGDSASDIESRSPARARIPDEISSDGGSRFSPEADLSDGSSDLEDGATEGEGEESPQDERAGSDEREADSLPEASDEVRTGSTEADSDGASEPLPPGCSADDNAGHQPHSHTDIYSSVSGMKLVVVDCFEELFDPGQEPIDEDREIRDAIDTGMGQRWNFFEAARAHRALTKCMNLKPGTVLYKRLFFRLASALVKAFEVRGTPEQQKSVFLMEATASFEVQVENHAPNYYFDNLHLIPELFHADLLVTKLIHKHIAHARWLQVPRPENLGVNNETPWQWTQSGTPLVSGRGVSDVSRGHAKQKAKAGAKSKPKRKRRSRRRTMLDWKGSSRTIKYVQGSTSESDSEPQTRQRNATETQGGGSITPVKDKLSENDEKELEKAVLVYEGNYSAIWGALKLGAIRMEKKDICQQHIRTNLLAQKRKLLQSDRRLPQGFDYLSMDARMVQGLRKKGKNPWRREADVDSNGQPTNTEWDPCQDPKLNDATRPQVMVAKGATGSEAGLSATEVRDLSGQGGHRVQPSPIRSSPIGREGSGWQQASILLPPNAVLDVPTQAAHNIQSSPVHPSPVEQESPILQQGLLASQGQQAGMYVPPNTGFNFSMPGAYNIQPSPIHPSLMRQESPILQQGLLASQGQQAGMYVPPNTGFNFPMPGAYNIQPSPIRPSLIGQESPEQQQGSPASQGQQAGIGGFRQMIPSKTVKPGRKGRDIQHKPWQ